MSTIKVTISTPEGKHLKADDMKEVAKQLIQEICRINGYDNEAGLHTTLALYLNLASLPSK